MFSHQEEGVRFDWRDVNEDILKQIIKKLKLYKDFATFRCVCRSWHQAAPVRDFTFWLMLPSKQEDTASIQTS